MFVHFSKTKKDATPAISYAKARLCMAVRSRRSPVREHCDISCLRVTLIFPLASKVMLGELFSARISCSRLVHDDNSKYFKLFSSHCCTALSTSWCEGSNCWVIKRPESLALTWLMRSTFSASGRTFASECSVLSTFCLRSCKHSAWLSKKSLRYRANDSPAGLSPNASSKNWSNGVSSFDPGWY